MTVEDEKLHDRQGLLSPDDIDSLENEGSEEHLNSADARLKSYDSAEAYSSKSQGGSEIYKRVMARFSPKTVRHLLVGLGVTLLLILGASMLPGRRKEVEIHWPGPAINDSSHTFQFTKPEGIKIRAVMFYGRAKFVDLLDCYLQKNLAVNGGFLDDVIFMKNTGDKADLAYLDQLTAKVPQYTQRELQRPGDVVGWGGFKSIWEHLTEDNTIYIKIDDDIVWLHDDAIPRVVSSLIKHPEAHDIGANMINSPLTDFFHYHNDAVYPFLPENAPHPTDGQQFDWRVNDLPAHDGNVPGQYEFNTKARPPAGFAVGQKGGPPYANHRWLMLPNDKKNTVSAQLQKTPIAAASYEPFGMAWTSWAMAAQQHYSLFKNIEDETTSKYWFGNAEGLWNMHYTRYNLNFLAIWGSSIAKALPGRDDEQDLTVTIPKMLGKPCLVDTHALVAHFKFGTQPELVHTDLLDRYRSLANEKACKPDNQKKRLAKYED